jgi:hypothetical protein
MSKLTTHKGAKAALDSCFEIYNNKIMLSFALLAAIGYITIILLIQRQLN